MEINKKIIGSSQKNIVYISKDAKVRKKVFLVLAFLFPIIGFSILLGLYNEWFDTFDKIKNDSNYSPEFDQNKTKENFIFWVLITASMLLEYLLIKKNKSYAAPNNTHSSSSEVNNIHIKL